MKHIKTIYLALFTLCVFTGNLNAQSVVKYYSPLTSNMEASGNEIVLSPGFSTNGFTFATQLAETYSESYVNPSPDGDKNYIWTKSYTYPTTTESATQVGDILNDIQYFDGLGRLIQNVSHKAGPWGEEIVQHVEYDGFGRQKKDYLPVALPGNKGKFIAIGENGDYSLLNNFYNGVLYPDAEGYAYAEKKFDNSPLNRVMKQGAPGAAWQTDQHPVEYEYTTNTSTDAVKGWNLQEDWEFYAYYNFYPFTYAPGTLYKTITYDEDDKEIVEYTDKQGRVIMKEAEGNARTYYVYDDFGLLRCVVPPKAEGQINSSTQSLCYFYKYDGRDRMIKKKLPDARPVYMVYDKRDRLVATQDGNQRDPDGNGNPSDNLWLYTKYDQYDRPIMTGLYTDSRSIDDLQAYVNTFTGTSLYENRVNSTSQNLGYTNNQSFPVSPPENKVLTVTLYDNYEFFSIGLLVYQVSKVPGYSSAVFDCQNETVHGEAVNTSVTGIVTATLARILEDSYDGDNSNWIFTVNYYDKEYRLIKTVNNNYLGYADEVTNQYDFVGNVEKTVTVNNYYDDALHAVNTVEVTHNYDYDHAGRLRGETQQITGDNINTDVEVSKHSYNGIGQLVTKDLHGGLQSIDYKYNIRGWLTGINDPTNLGDDLFGMELCYNNSDLPGAGPLFNGNISGILWKNSELSQKRGYVYTYDDLNRIESAMLKTHNGSAWSATNLYGVSGITYDKNGNIQTLNRYGTNTTDKMDVLTYNYYSSGNSNKLLKVTDGADPSVKDGGFVDGSSLATEYTYDDNGNLVRDENKGANISYNILNLPYQVTKDGSSTITNMVYDATGRLWLRGDAYIGRYSDNIYLGSLVVFDEYYSGTNFKYLLTSEGRVTKPSGNYVYEYYIKDHLGNTRVAFEATGGSPVVRQVNDYYPFGMQHLPIALSHDNPYLYNGKEFIENNGLDWYDYGARFFDPALARFTSIDPLAQSYNSWSPYHYAANNPIRKIDGHGMGWKDVLDGIQLGLDVVGMIPGAGNVADLINAGISTVRGNYGEALLSLAAAVPGAGIGVGAGKVIGKTVDKVNDFRKLKKLKKVVQEGGEIIVDQIKIGDEVVEGKIIVTEVSEATGAAKKELNAALDSKYGELPKPNKGKGSVSPDQRDPKRTYTKKERAEMLEDQDGKCIGCGESKTVDEVQGHHKQRHADGGQTTKENGAALCEDCHKEIHK